MRRLDDALLQGHSIALSIQPQLHPQCVNHCQTANLGPVLVEVTDGTTLKTVITVAQLLSL